MTDDDASSEAMRHEGGEGGRRAADPDRLLPGEDPDTRHREDALHWMAVYRELISFKEQVLGITRRVAADAQPDVAEEVKSSDLRLLAAELDRLQRRFDFWQKRDAELEDTAAP